MKILLTLLFCFCLNGQLIAQSMSLNDFNQRFEEELAKITQTRKSQTGELKIKYLGALLRLENQAKNQGNLDLVQAARAEITLVETGGKIGGDSEAVPEQLMELRIVMKNLYREYEKAEAEQVVALADKLKAYALNVSVEYTRQNEIEKAVAWQNWSNEVANDDLVGSAYAIVNKPHRNTRNGDNPKQDFHENVRGTPAKIIEEKMQDFEASPRVYRKGKEPEGNEKRIRSSTPSMQGAGNTQLTGTLMLIEEKSISKSGYSGNYKEKSLTYVPRLSISPIVGKSLDPCLVVFDLYKRGSGSKRGIIRTDKIVIPSLSASDQIVIDAGKYEYETEEYDSSFSTYEYKYSTEDEFYGFIVTLFNTNGELIFQRASERILNDYARETPPE
jgi:hypothetical protein